MYFVSFLTSLPILLAVLGRGQQTCNDNTAADSLEGTSSAPSWLLDRLSQFGLQLHHFENTGRGLQTLHDRSPGDTVISVPKSEALTATWVLKRFPILDRAANKSIKEYDTKLSDEQILAAGLLLLRSKYAQRSDEEVTIQEKYVASLPEQQYSVLQMPNIFMDCLPLAYQNIIRAYQDRVQHLQLSLLRCFDDDDDMEKEVRSLLQSFSDFQWAFATVRSRCVGMDADDEDVDKRIRTGAVDADEVRVMLPGFDLLNHRFGAKSTHDYDPAKDAYTIRSEDEYSAGDQVFISYSDQRDNLKMLMTYGFCARDNPVGDVFFDTHDLLLACSDARPHYFTPETSQQIEDLLANLGKELLYEFDGINQQPKPDLESGIRMLEELEKQFLPEGSTDVSFYQEVLDGVLAIRRNEVTAGLKRTEKILQQSNGEDDGDDDYKMLAWKPLLKSFQVLLEAELGFIPSSGKSEEQRL